MRVGVKVRKRDKQAEDFGHMWVYWVLDSELLYRGYRFVPTDLPEEFRPRSRWREYFLEKGESVPGRITDDINLRDTLEQMPDAHLCKSWPLTSEQAQKLCELADPPRQFGRYSFKADPKKGWYNCVAWAIDTINQSLGSRLPEVKDWRIKYIVEELEGGVTQ